MFKKNVVILGGGFAGVSAALELIRHKEEYDLRITLIDKNSYHTFTPSLYEVATCEETQKNIVISFGEIFGRKVHVVKGEITTINLKDKFIKTKDKKHFYFDYLIIAMGSESSCFGISSIEKYGYSLKSVVDAYKIQEKIRDIFHKEAEHKKINIVVGGGGFSGTELTAELVCFQERLAKEYSCKNSCVKITVIQGSERLLKELDQEASETAKKRLEALGVKICLKEHIKNVDKKNIETDAGNSYSYDVFIWTGGVRSVSVLAKNDLPVNARGQIMVNDCLQVAGFDNILAAGDNAEFIDSLTKQHAPGVAEVAESQGKLSAENIIRHLKKEKLLKYKIKHSGYIIPLKGKFAILEMKNFHIAGFIGWIAQQYVVLRYFLSILSLPKAFRRWNNFEKDLRQN